MRLIEIFFPEAARSALPIALQKRVPFLVWMNILFVIYFTITSIIRYQADPSLYLPFLVAISMTDIAYISSLVLIRLRRYEAASWLMSLGILLNVTWIGVLLPSSGHMDLYRFTCYLMASVIANSMASISRRQIAAFAGASLVDYGIVAFFVISPAAGGFEGEMRVITATVFVLVVAVNIVIFFIDRLGAELIALAEDQMTVSKEKADRLVGLIASSKGSLEVGEELKRASDDGLSASGSIRAALGGIDADARSLSGSAASADGTTRGVVGYAQSMKETVISQSAILEETSAAIEQITATIRNIASVAEQKKGTIDRVLKAIQGQGRDIAVVLEGISRIKGTSARVLEVAGAILDVSEKTNLLAMNASIEAAHAGGAGRGFAVISGEIRKLSEETKQSTRSIGDALGANDSAIEGASATIRKFASSLQEAILDVQETFNALEEILNGLTEISTATSELTASTGRMVAISRETEDSVKGVASSVESGAESIEGISRFSGELSGKVAKLADDFSAIEEAMRKVAAIGDRNIGNIAKLSEDMGRIIV